MISEERFVTMPLRKPKRVQWNPLPDITAYELARCIPVLMAMNSFPEDLIPEDCERHFTVETV